MRHEYGAEEIRRFLQAIDRNRARRVRVEIIGGAAATLAYGVQSTTEDIDTYNGAHGADPAETVEAARRDDAGVELQEAVSRAVRDTGLEIPMQHATVADVPYNYQDRLHRQLPELENLEVWILEKHDLALSKAVRCNEGDLQQILEMHEAVRLDFDTLVDRFNNEMKQTNGDPTRIRNNFLDMIDYLFGEMKRIAAEASVPLWTW